MSQHDDETERLIVYSDYLCPFCYLGKESMETYLDASETSLEIEWRPFDIQGHKRGADGELSEDVDDGKDEAYFERAKRNVQRLKEKYDVEMDLDLALDVDSWNAQKVALAVERQCDRSTFLALHDALFEALWREGRDIGDPEVLLELAEEHGVDPDLVGEDIDDETLDEELEAKFEQARQTGIRGIPTFIYGEHITQGAVPPDHFARLLAMD